MEGQKDKNQQIYTRKIEFLKGGIWKSSVPYHLN